MPDTQTNTPAPTTGPADQAPAKPTAPAEQTAGATKAEDAAKPAQAGDDGTDWKAQARKWEERAKSNTDMTAKILEALGIKPGKDDKADPLEAVKSTVAGIQRDLLVERIAREAHITDEAHLALLAKQPDEETMRSLSEVLAARAKEDTPPVASPADAGIGSGGASAVPDTPGASRMAAAFDSQINKP